MLVRHALVLAFVGTALVGCGASAVPSGAPLNANASSAMRFISPMGQDSTPTIKKVSKIDAVQYQHIVIRGNGFGKMKPYNGDSCCIEFVVSNPACYYYGSYGTWQAGYESSNPNLVTLNVTKWSNKKIVVSGFTGDYGQRCWVLIAGQAITINVWNAQTEAGPASWSGKIK